MSAQPDQYLQTHRELRRALNADRRQQFGDSGRLLALICECGDPLCHATILMSARAFDAHGDAPIVSHEIHT